MTLISVQTGMVMLSTKKSISQTDVSIPRCARIYKVVPLEQA